MICVGIDVAKDKHDCFILSSEGEVLADVFTIQNNAEGFDTLLQTIRRCVCPGDKIKVGLEATGHYSYQSGQLSLSGAYSHMEKRGSRYLRYALYNATKYVCLWDPVFAAYLAKKRTEGKHYNVALSLAAKKLVRLIYAMEKSRQSYRNAA